MAPHLAAFLTANARPPLVVLPSGRLQTFGRKLGDGGYVQVNGELDPSKDLAPFTASAADQAAAFLARYGVPEGAGTGAGEATIDLSPLYVANGWSWPVDPQDIEDVKMIVGAVAFLQALPAYQPEQAAPVPPPPAANTSATSSASAAPAAPSIDRGALVEQLVSQLHQERMSALATIGGPPWYRTYLENLKGSSVERRLLGLLVDEGE